MVTAFLTTLLVKFCSMLILNLDQINALFLLQTPVWSFCHIIASNGTVESSSAEFFAEVKICHRSILCW